MADILVVESCFAEQAFVIRAYLTLPFGNQRGVIAEKANLLPRGFCCSPNSGNHFVSGSFASLRVVRFLNCFSFFFLTRSRLSLAREAPTLAESSVDIYFCSPCFLPVSILSVPSGLLFSNLDLPTVSRDVPVRLICLDSRLRKTTKIWYRSSAHNFPRQGSAFLGSLAQPQ